MVTEEFAPQEEVQQEQPEEVVEDTGEEVGDVASPTEEPSEDGDSGGGAEASTGGRVQPGGTEPSLVGQSPPSSTPEPVAPSPADERTARELEELYRIRQVNAQKEWENGVIRQAQQVRKQAQDRGVDDRSAEQLARQFVGHRRDLRDQESKALDVIQHSMGRQMAMMEIGKEFKLLSEQNLEDMRALLLTRTVPEMKREAQRISQLRSQRDEITRLKQGRVAPQNFDNSQGASEATTNQDRLLTAYINGDRSEAATNAARRLALGN